MSKKNIYLTIYLITVFHFLTAMSLKPKFDLNKKYRYIIRKKFDKNLKPIVAGIPLHIFLKQQQALAYGHQKLSHLNFNQGIQSNSVNSVPQFSSSASVTNASSDLPEDLRDLAITLGFPNEERLPDLDLISGFLGTQSREETINLIRSMASTRDGRETIRSYLQIFLENYPITSSSTTTTTTTTPSPPTTEDSGNQIQYQSSYIQPSSVPVFGGLVDRTHTNVGILNNVISTPRPELGFFDRMTSWFSYFRTSDNSEVPLNTISEQNLTDQVVRPRYIGYIPQRSDNTEILVNTLSEQNPTDQVIHPRYVGYIPQRSDEIKSQMAKPIPKSFIPFMTRMPSTQYFNPHNINRDLPFVYQQKNFINPAVNLHTRNNQKFVSDIPLSRNYHDNFRLYAGEKISSYDVPLKSVTGSSGTDWNNSDENYVGDNGKVYDVSLHESDVSNELDEDENGAESKKHESVELSSSSRLHSTISDNQMTTTVTIATVSTTNDHKRIELNEMEENIPVILKITNSSIPQRVSGFETYATGRIHKADPNAIDLLMINLNDEIPTTSTITAKNSVMTTTNTEATTNSSQSKQNNEKPDVTY